MSGLSAHKLVTFAKYNALARTRKFVLASTWITRLMAV